MRCGGQALMDTSCLEMSCLGVPTEMWANRHGTYIQHLCLLGVESPVCCRMDYSNESWVSAVMSFGSELSVQATLCVQAFWSA